MNTFLLATSLVPENSFEFTATVVVAGLGIVLGTLALLIVIFNIFGKAVSFSQNKKEKEKVVTTNDERKYPDISEMKVEEPPEPLGDGEINGSVVAAITAAVYMLEGEGAKVKSISPKGKRSKKILSRSRWAQSAVDYNSRPF